MQPLGFTVYQARDGKTCVQLAAQCQPQLAMVDLSLPDMSGWDVARALRGTPELEGLKILIVSANAHEYAPGAAAPGAATLIDAFITKPVELQSLLERVGTLLRLDWIYEPPASACAPQTAAIAASNPSGRSRHHIDDLYRLGRIGHVRGIEAKLRELELEDPANEAFAAQLRGLVSNFDLKRYMNVLEALRADA